MCETDAQIEL